MTGVLVPLIIFGSITAWLLGPKWLKMLHEHGGITGDPFKWNLLCEISVSPCLRVPPWFTLAGAREAVALIGVRGAFPASYENRRATARDHSDGTGRRGSGEIRRRLPMHVTT